MMETREASYCFVIRNPVMRRIEQRVLQLAKVNVAVLIVGESGTGKEVIARMIHANSPRSDQTFMKVNCAALPADLLESELFGYEAGAFTGAVRAKPGKFEQCDKGTIFLDEIGEMPTSLQAKLLHVLQDGEFMRLGGRSKVKVDVRVIAATNVNIKQAMENNQFREDLYYRVGSFVVDLPPLRERPDDIPVLLEHCIEKFSKLYGVPPVTLSPEVLDLCLSHSWPGNVRELENVARRLLILGDKHIGLSPDRKLPSTPPQSETVSARGEDDLKTIVRGLKEGAEREAIRRALEETHWNRKQAARQLKISYKALLYKIRAYGLDHTPRKLPHQPAILPTSSLLRRSAAAL
jgi:transcriptional regulator with PAS, ATPase and Fis domain